MFSVTLFTIWPDSWIVGPDIQPAVYLAKCQLSGRICGQMNIRLTSSFDPNLILDMLIGAMLIQSA